MRTLSKRFRCFADRTHASGRVGTLADVAIGIFLLLTALGLIVTFIILAVKLFRGPAHERDPLLLLSMRSGSATTGAGIRWARSRCKFNDAVSEFTTEPATFRACCET